MKTIELKLAPEAINVILAGLEELPHKISRRVLDEVLQQCQAQAQPAPAAPPAPPATPEAPAIPTEPNAAAIPAVDVIPSTEG